MNSRGRAGLAPGFQNPDRFIVVLDCFFALSLSDQSTTQPLFGFREVRPDFQCRFEMADSFI
jgi:hypothetical protein